MEILTLVWRGVPPSSSHVNDVIQPTNALVLLLGLDRPLFRFSEIKSAWRPRKDARVQ